jgi:hypothetical protein
LDKQSDAVIDEAGEQPIDPTDADDAVNGQNH